MNCPKCSCPDMRVIRSNYDQDHSVDRRRQCEQCGSRITTREIVKEKLKEKTEHVFVT